MFTVEDGINVAVSCCVAWSFSTSDIESGESLWSLLICSSAAKL